MLDLRHGLGRGQGRETVVSVCLAGETLGVTSVERVGRDLAGQSTRNGQAENDDGAGAGRDADRRQGLPKAEGDGGIALLRGEKSRAASSVGDGQGEDLGQVTDIVDQTQTADLCLELSRGQVEAVSDVVGVCHRLHAGPADEGVGKRLHLGVRASEQIGTRLGDDNVQGYQWGTEWHCTIAHGRGAGCGRGSGRGCRRDRGCGAERGRGDGAGCGRLCAQRRRRGCGDRAKGAQGCARGGSTDNRGTGAERRGRTCRVPKHETDRSSKKLAYGINHWASVDQRRDLGRGNTQADDLVVTYQDRGNIGIPTEECRNQRQELVNGAE